jgi:glyoxylate reductase
VLANTPDMLTNATADLTLGLLLAVQRRMLPAMARLKAGTFQGWDPFFEIAPGLEGKQLGLIGCGRIGQAVAKRANAFGLQVVYTQRRRLDEALESALNLTHLPLEALLQTSDMVSLHCPLTPETRGLLSAERLALMKQGASLINTARGPIVDEAALAAHLKSGHLHGAGLDVFEREPEVHEALWHCENAVLLPHIGSATKQTRQAMADRMLENLLCFFAEKPIPNQVV